MLVVLFTVSLLAPLVQSDEWHEKVVAVLGRRGVTQDGMLKFTFPRSDLSAKVGEVPLSPGLGLTSWIGFQPMGKQVIMMGDLVLLEQEVAPVSAKLVAEGVKLTALHNHLIFLKPAVMYLHIGGDGDPVKLAAAVRAALALTGTPMTPPPPPEPNLDPAKWAPVEAILGSGERKGNLLLFGFKRKEKIVDRGMEVPPFMGVASPINLQMVGGKVACTGHLVLIGNEVNPVAKALLDHEIDITAIHSHMLLESPRLFFLHFWAYGEPEKVAAGLKAALDQVNFAR